MSRGRRTRRARRRPDRPPPARAAGVAVSGSGSSTVMSGAPDRPTMRPPGSRAAMGSGGAGPRGSTVMAQVLVGVAGSVAVEDVLDGGVGPPGLLLHVGAAGDGGAHVVQDLLALDLGPELAGRDEPGVARGGLGLGLGGLLDHRRRVGGGHRLE